MIQKHIAEDIFGHTRKLERFSQTFTHQRCLACMFQHHHIARNKCRRDGVDSRHERIIPGRHNKDDALRLSGDVTLEVSTILKLKRRQRPLRNFRHVTCTLVETAKFSAIPNRASHLPGKLRHNLVIHRAHFFSRL